MYNMYGMYCIVVTTWKRTTSTFCSQKRSKRTKAMNRKGHRTRIWVLCIHFFQDRVHCALSFLYCPINTRGVSSNIASTQYDIHIRVYYKISITQTFLKNICARGKGYLGASKKIDCDGISPFQRVWHREEINTHKRNFVNVSCDQKSRVTNTMIKIYIESLDRVQNK